MQSEATRAAFTLSPIHQRRDQHRITSLAVLQNATRVFLGLDNGILEEHSCLASTAAGGMAPVIAAAAGGMLVLRLLAEKKVFSKQALVEICAAEAAARLVCLSEEGQVALVSLETFAVVALPAARGAVALAVQHTQHLPVLLAVATKHGKGRSKVLIFNILPGANVTGGHQPAVLVCQTTVNSTVLGLAWAGKSLLIAVPNGYQALTPNPQQPQAAAPGSSSTAASYQITVLADHLHEISPMLGAVPDLGLGLMLWEENMVLVADAAGAAVREPLQLPMQPLSLTAAGMFIVALCDDGIHVFDRNSSREVQHIDFAHDDAYVRLQQRIPTAADEHGRAIVLATSEAVFRLEPIAIEQQVRELLKRKRFDQALDLISATPPPSAAAAAAAAGEEHSSLLQPSNPGGRPPWQQVALAQAGLLLLLECEIEAGLGVLEGLPAEVWQPCQLFGLFPGVTARWLSKVPNHSYWGLHGHHLPDLQQLVTDMLELRAATAPRNRHHRQQQQLLPHLPLQQQQQQGQEGPGRLALSSPAGGSSSSLSSISSASAAAAAAGVNPADMQTLVQQAKTAIAAYLSKVRSRSDVMLSDGIDTLLLQLLCDTGDAAAVEALVSSSSNAAVVSAGVDALRAAGRWHGLALLLINAGQPAEALRTWKGLAAGDLTESPSPTGAVAAADGNAAAIAVAAAAAAMAAGPDKVPLQLLLESGSLQWLLSQDSAASLAVLESRPDLEASTVMQLLEETGDIDLKWQYLYHQVHQGISSDSKLHTQLATVLLAALAALIGSSSSSSEGSAAADRVTAEQLAAMVQQLPLLFNPNTLPANVAAAAAPAAAAAADPASSSSSSRQLLVQVQGSGFGGLPPRSPLGLRQGSAGQSNMSFPGQSNMLLSPRDTRAPSLMGAGVPSALYFAASVADISKRATQDPTAAAAGAVPALRQQQRPLQQRYKSIGALAGQSAVSKTAAAAAASASGRVQPSRLQVPAGGLSRQGTATQGFLLSPRTPGLSLVSPGIDWGLVSPNLQRGISKTSSNIADMLIQQHQQQLMQEAAFTAATTDQPKAQQQRQQQHEGQQQQQQGLGLRVLPTGYGPWPIQQHDSQQAAATAVAADQQNNGAGADHHHQQQQDDAAAAAEIAAVTAVCDKVLLLRCLLVYHLQASLLYDAEAVLSAAQQLPLYPEHALLQSRASNHPAALALLALYPPRLVEGAITYCRALGSAEAWLALLELFLNPKQTLEGLGWLKPSMARPHEVGVALEPDYASACRVLNAEGASLNPLRLLAALPADMPLHLAGEMLGYVMCGLQHRRRYGQVVRNLERSRRLATHADLVSLQNARVLVTDDTACNGCGRLIGSKVFYRYPSGVVVCSRCSGAVAAAGAGDSSVSAGAAALVGAEDNSWELL